MRSSLTHVGVALAAGLTAAVIIGVAVTSTAERYIEFSLFVGLPAGLLAGLLTGWLVAVRLARDDPERRRRLLGAIGGFAVGFLVVGAGLIVASQGGLTVVLGGGLLAGSLGTVAGYGIVQWSQRNRTVVRAGTEL